MHTSTFRGSVDSLDTFKQKKKKKELVSHALPFSLTLTALHSVASGYSVCSRRCEDSLVPSVCCTSAAGACGVHPATTTTTALSLTASALLLTLQNNAHNSVSSKSATLGFLVTL